MNPADIPLALYVHLPWCVKKCPYCDFNSFAAASPPPRKRYLAALILDLDLHLGEVFDRELASVFIGGGTPSLFTPGEIDELLTAVRARFRLADGVEITMEANPGTVECGSPAGYLAAGVNRLSIGAQSFSARSLLALGRVHSPEAIAETFAEARAAGFASINLDIMYGLPGQDVAAACFDLKQAAALEPEHLSWYHLTLEPNTIFYHRPPAGLPDESLAADIQDAGQAALEGFGFGQYEVSAWASAPRYRCRHNLNYWTFGDYLAVGAGAHGKLTRPGGVFRYARPANPEAYMQGIEAGRAELSPAAGTAADLRFEFMLNALRLNDGFSLAAFEARTGLEAGSLGTSLDGLVRRGLLESQGGGRYAASRLGRSYLNDLMAEFLPAESP
ncbi:MAG: radical SAM family heme chaperone HemW [Pseudomonadota bacterium]